MHTRTNFATGLAVLALTIMAVAPLAEAGEIQGKVTKVDKAGRVVTLDDGTALKVMNAAQLAEIRPGATVKASYEERNGEKIARSIQVEKGGADRPAGAAQPRPAPPRPQ